VLVGEGNADRHLAVILLAQLPAVLARDPDRVRALLRKARVIDQQRLRLSGARHDLLQHMVAHRRQHRIVRPRRIGHEMMQALMLGTHSRRRQMRRHGLDTLPLHRQHQPRAVATKWLHPIGVTQLLRNQRHVSLKPFRGSSHLLGSLTKQLKMGG
jgi:hypothetical protein